MAEGSMRVVLTALAGNLAIAATKFVAFAFTGSAAMATEGVHSVVDTLDQGLLLLAEKRAARPANEAHPFGYGLEAYFWSFVVALVIFLAGGAAAVWEGIEKLQHPGPIARTWISYLVLAMSAGFEGASFRVAYREFRRTVRGRDVKLWRFLQLSKDPSLFTTLMEDGAALTGLAIAALGVFGTASLHLAWADGAASLGIGLLLVAVAAFLANETRSLITGEAAAPPIRARLCEVLEGGDPRLKVVDMVTLHLGAKTILVAARLKPDPGMSLGEATATAKGLEAELREAEPRVGPVYLSLV